MNTIVVNFKNKEDKETTNDLLNNLKYKTNQQQAVVLNKALRLYNIMIDKGLKII